MPVSLREDRQTAYNDSMNYAPGKDITIFATEGMHTLGGGTTSSTIEMKLRVKKETPVT